MSEADAHFGVGGRFASDLAAARRLRELIGRLEGWRRNLAAALAGALSILAMAPFHAWPVLFVTLPIFYWLLQAPGQTRSSLKLRLGRAAVIGWCFGFGYHLAGLYWIGGAFLVEADRFAWLMPFAVLVMPAGLALFTALAAAAFAAAHRRDIAPLGRLAVFVAALTLSEWLRGTVLTGFPWNTLGYALTMPLPMMQSAALVGIYGLTALAVWTTTVPLVLCSRPLDGAAASRSSVALKPRFWSLLLSICPLALLFVYGSIALKGSPIRLVDGPKLRVVQPSIPQADKFRQEKQRTIFDAHLALTRSASANPPVTHVVWPEAAMPFLALREPVVPRDIAAALPAGAQLIAGTLRLGEPQRDQLGRLRVHNSTVVFANDGKPGVMYDKLHLVPFGEYLPFQDTLEALGLEQLTRVRGGFAPGQEPRPVIEVAGLPPVAFLICYEAIFPHAVAGRRGHRPGLLVNMTNDAWFGATTGPYQHAHQVRVRAVEQGIAMVRSANNGISAIFDPRGRVLAKLGLYEVGVIDSRIPAAASAPLYARHGLLIDWSIALLCAAMIFAAAVKRRAGLDNP